MQKVLALILEVEDHEIEEVLPVQYQLLVLHHGKLEVVYFPQCCLCERYIHVNKTCLWLP